MKIIEFLSLLIRRFILVPIFVVYFLAFLVIGVVLAVPLILVSFLIGLFSTEKKRNEYKKAFEELTDTQLI